ncbi:hypothetical protein HHK36_004788 [Tetracentron sinense]|uniref:ALOG domain-containing protein n=1 Tax=Tetracentron sinense TaxID=13715 RepID=A0A835DLQ0_TETSI|nr:hypothetical protein HHK36_004788 [Tetracentron sinense]
MSAAAATTGGESSNTKPGTENSRQISTQPSRYESQKRRDWNTFGQYLKNHRPPLTLSRCSGAHVLEFLRYLDQFGKTKVHAQVCPYYGHPHPPAPCPCPLRQAWGSLDALIGRLRAAFEENGGEPEANPFGARAVRLFLREVRDHQAKARGIAYEKKRKRPGEVSPMNVNLLHSTRDLNSSSMDINYLHHHGHDLIQSTEAGETVAMEVSDSRAAVFPLSVLN